MRSSAAMSSRIRVRVRVSIPCAVNAQFIAHRQTDPFLAYVEGEHAAFPVLWNLLRQLRIIEGAKLITEAHWKYFFALAVFNPERPTTDKTVSLAISVIALAASIALLYFGKDFFITMIVSTVFAFILDPLVVLVMKLRVPRARCHGHRNSSGVGGGISAERRDLDAACHLERGPAYLQFAH